MLFKPGSIRLLTFFLMAKNSAASATVQIGASSQLLYLAVEEVLQPVSALVLRDSTEEEWIDVATGELL